MNIKNLYKDEMPYSSPEVAPRRIVQQNRKNRISKHSFISLICTNKHAAKHRPVSQISENKKNFITYEWVIKIKKKTDDKATG